MPGGGALLRGGMAMRSWTDALLLVMSSGRPTRDTLADAICDCHGSITPAGVVTKD